MADTVEIQNVGGLRGVASEATLLELLDAIVAQNRGGSSGSRLSSRLQDAYNRSLTETNREQGRLAKAFNYITNNAAGRFAKELAFGGNRVSNFSDAIFGAGSSISILTGYLDDNIDTWRELSSVGASFNNSIFDMIGSAANSGMELDDFSKMVIKNSEQMAKFGGTVTNGAKFVGDFSKTFRRDLGSRFFEMGFTIGDINESLIDFMSLESRRSANGLRNDKKTQESAANYTLQLDKLAKLTGIERKQLADRIAQQQTDAGLAARINSLQGTQRSNLESVIALFDEQLPAFSDGFKDLMDGVAQTDLGKALESVIPGIGPYMQKVFTGEEDLNEVLATLNNKFGPALADYASGFGPNAKAQFDAMRAAGDVPAAIAEILDAQYQLTQLSQLNADEAAKEQGRRNAVTSTLGKFEQAVVDLRKMFVDFFYDFAMEEGGLFDALSGLGQVVKDLTSPGTNGLGGLGTLFVTFAKDNIFGLFGKDGSITKAITDSTAWLKSDDFKVYVENLKESIASVTTWFSELVDDIRDKGFWNTFKERIFDLGNWIKELFFGSTVTEMTPDGPQEVRNQGLFEDMVDAFMQFWEGPYGKEMANKIIDYFAELASNILKKTFGSEGMFDAATGGSFGLGGTTSQIEKLIARMDSGETLTQEELDQIVSYSAETSRAEAVSKGGFNAVLGRIGQATGMLTDLTADAIGTGMDQSVVHELAKKAVETKKLLEENNYDLSTPGQQPEGVTIDPTAGFANGTNGFRNFGSGTMAMLHNSEAVVPRNTTAGDLLQSFYDFQNKKVAAVTSTPMASDNQSSLIKKVEELNTTMMQVAELLQSSVGLQAKTVKGVKGLGSDFYRGIGR